MIAGTTRGFPLHELQIITSYTVPLYRLLHYVSHPQQKSPFTAGMLVFINRFRFGSDQEGLKDQVWIFLDLLLLGLEPPPRYTCSHGNLIPLPTFTGILSGTVGRGRG